MEVSASFIFSLISWIVSDCGIVVSEVKFLGDVTALEAVSSVSNKRQDLNTYKLESPSLAVEETTVASDYSMSSERRAL